MRNMTNNPEIEIRPPNFFTAIQNQPRKYIVIQSRNGSIVILDPPSNDPVVFRLDSSWTVYF